MSGHSHWQTIQRVKQAEDRKRGKLFSKLSREIEVAAEEGDDPETNFKLRVAIEKAKEANMPKKNIKRALKRAGDKLKKGKTERVVFEGFGPQGVAILVQARTDNRRRTTAQIRQIFEQAGGSLGKPGAVAHQFRPQGLLVVEKGKEAEETMLKIMDLGVEDVREVEDGIEVFTPPKSLNKIKKKLMKAGFQVKSFLLTQRPLTEIRIGDKKRADQILALMEALDEEAAVEEVYANFDIDPAVL